MTAPSTLQAAEQAYRQAVYGGSTYDPDPVRALHDLVAAQIAVETPQERISRLMLEADEKDRSEAFHVAEEASLAGRIAGRRMRFGADDEQAHCWEIQRSASERCAVKCALDAAALRSEAATLNRRAAYADAVVSHLHAAE